MRDSDLEIVREAVRMFSEGDIEGLGRCYAEDSRIVAPEGWPEAGATEGRDAVVGQFALLREDWSHHQMTIVSERVVGDWAVLEHNWQAEGAASGARFDVVVIGAYRVRDGQIAEGRFFWSLEEAFADVGLAEGRSGDGRNDSGPLGNAAG